MNYGCVSAHDGTISTIKSKNTCLDLQHFLSLLTSNSYAFILSHTYGGLTLLGRQTLKNSKNIV